jgi:hypothetical protein
MNTDSNRRKLSERQLKRRSQFLWSITFSKPYWDLKDRILLEKSGIGVKKARRVVVASLLLSFLLTIGSALLLLRMVDVGEGFFLLFFPLLFFFSHFQIAKLMTHFYKRGAR